MTTSAPLSHLSIRASAGSGKTYQLTNRFLKLLALGIPPERILATTFTRKAAGEILARVLSRLAAAASDSKSCEELGQTLKEPDFSPKFAIRLLQMLVRNLNSVRVATLDSFFAQLAGSYCLEVGLPAGWKILDEVVERRIRSEAIRAVLAASTEDVATLMRLLTKGEATRSISDQIEGIVESMYAVFLDTRPEAWQVLTRDRPLPDEELRAVIEALGNLEFPSKGMADARNDDYQRLSKRAWEEFIAHGIPKKIIANDPTFRRQRIPDDALELYRKLIEHARAVLLGRAAQQTEATYQLLEHFHRDYHRRKLAYGSVRFDDVTRALAHAPLAESWDEASHRLDASVEHLLLDEFQDTSLLQWQALAPLAIRLLRPPPDSKTFLSFFSVGDAKQAIYGWRGGCAEIFDSLKQDFDSIQWEPLTKSYRSSPVIMDVVNEIFEYLGTNAALRADEQAARHWRGQFEKHSTARTDLPGYFRLQTARMAAPGEKQSVVTLEWAAQEVQRLSQAAPTASIGILLRDNAAVARMILTLKHLSVPASEEGGTPLSDSPAVSLILSLLTLADHPGDSVAAFHVASSPLGATTDLDPESQSSRSLFAKRIRRELLTDGYGRVLRKWSRRLASICDQRDRDRLDALVELAYRFEISATTRPGDFTEHVLATKSDDPQTSRVRVMTIHQSKGLEFDIVVLPQLDKRILGQPPAFVVRRPHATAPIDVVCRYANEGTRRLMPPEIQEMFTADRDRRIRETLCLLYVALTRAVHTLHVIIAPSPASESKIPATLSGILRGALTNNNPGLPETILHEQGDPNWYGHDSAESPPAPPTPPIAKPAQQGLPFRPIVRRHRHLTRQTPSALEGGQLIDLRQKLRLDSGLSMDRGSMLHTLFERVAWLQDPPDREQLIAALNRFRLSTEQTEEILAEFAVMLQRPAIAEVLQPSRYLPKDAAPDSRLELWRERRFAFRENDLLWEGIFDRVVIVSQDGKPVRAEILDFKSDTLHSDDTAATTARVEYYRPQMKAYCKAAQKILGLSPSTISTVLVFVSAGVVVKVDE